MIRSHGDRSLTAADDKFDRIKVRWIRSCEITGDVQPASPTIEAFVHMSVVGRKDVRVIGRVRRDAVDTNSSG